MKHLIIFVIHLHRSIPFRLLCELIFRLVQWAEVRRQAEGVFVKLSVGFGLVGDERVVVGCDEGMMGHVLDSAFPFRFLSVLDVRGKV